MMILKHRIYLSTLIMCFTFGCTKTWETKEIQAKQKVLLEIEEANMAVENYFKIVEDEYSDLLDSKIGELDKAVKKIRTEYGSYTTSHRVAKKSKILQNHKQQLHQKFTELKSTYGEGCEGVEERIEELFKEVDDHLSILDSLIIDI